MPNAKPFIQLTPLVLLMLAGGCVQRTLTVRSDPPGALGYFNDVEYGRTPVTRPITWYGTYQVEIRKDGYQSVKTSAKVWAPWWQWVPFDLFTEVLPVTDHHELMYTLREPSEGQTDAAGLVER